MKSGIATLPLHHGKAPRWLFFRMKKLAREICIVLIEEYGPKELLRRIADPYWFQAFGCILGYDWHSSGLTTTVCAAIKTGLSGLEKDLGFFTTGGKGKTSRKTPDEIIRWGDRSNLKVNPEDLVYSSKMSAKVDSTAVQDGYQLYHHNFFFTNEGTWTVVQQGMNPQNRFARRYHWYSENAISFINEPQTAICDNHKYSYVLNLTAENSRESRSIITEISNQKPMRIIKEYKKIKHLSLPKREWIQLSDIQPKNLERVLIKTYEKQPNTFEELLSIKGLGPKSLRALALIAELTYGSKANWEDPVKYSFAHGGKDGYPYPVDKMTYDKSIETLKHIIRKTKLNKIEKRNILLKLL